MHMKLAIKTLLIVLLLAISNAGAEYQLSLGSLLRDMTSVGNSELDTIFKNTEELAKELGQQILENNQILQENLEKKTDKLKRQAELEALEIKKRAEEESSNIFRHYEKQASILQQQIHEDSAQITRQSMQKLLKIVSEAEAKALEVKGRKRQEKLEKAIEAISSEKFKIDKKLPSVSFMGLPRWIQLLSKEFSENITYLKNIISKGEILEEAEGFLEVFSNLKEWFSQTLRDIKSTNDPRYKQLINKKKSLDNVINAHKNAISFLKEKIAKINFQLPSKEKTDLIMLYEVNYILQEKSDNGIEEIAKAELTSEDLEVVINRVLRKIVPPESFQLYQDTTPTGKISFMTKEMTQQELDRAIKRQQEAEGKLEQIQEEKAIFEETIKQHIELKSGEKLELELQNKILSQRMDNAKKELSIAQEELKALQESSSKLKNIIVTQLENTTQEKLNLETVILDKKNELLLSQKEVAAIKGSLQVTKSILDAEEKKRLRAEKEAAEANQKSALISELTEKISQEIESKIKHYETQFTEKQNIIELKEKFVQEKKEILEARSQWLDDLSKSLKADQQETLYTPEHIEANNRRQLEDELERLMLKK